MCHMWCHDVSSVDLLFFVNQFLLFEITYNLILINFSNELIVGYRTSKISYNKKSVSKENLEHISYTMLSSNWSPFNKLVEWLIFGECIC